MGKTLRVLKLAVIRYPDALLVVVLASIGVRSFKHTIYRPVARIFYGWVRSVDYTDQRAPEALYTRGVRGHAPPGNFEN